MGREGTMFQAAAIDSALSALDNQRDIYDWAIRLGYETVAQAALEGMKDTCRLIDAIRPILNYVRV